MVKVMGVVRALAALLVLVGVVIGAPVALWRWGRPFLFDQIPTVSEVWSRLWSQDTGGVLLMAFLVIVGAVAWVVFTLCLLIDIASRLTGRRIPWRIPGLRLPQAAASALLTMVLTGGLMLGSVTAATAQPLPAPTQAAASVAASAPQVTQPVTPPAAAPAWTSPHPVGQKTWTVERYDTLSSIAEKNLGDWTLYPQIVELNIGAPQPDGQVLRDADTPLQVGWVMALPANAAVPESAAPAAVTPEPQSIAVQPGDTLSEIAQTTLGSAERYPELAAANNLSNPDYLEVGQIIEIPAPLEVSASPASTAQEPVEIAQAGGQDAAPPDAQLAEPAAPSSPVDPTAAPVEQAPVEQTPVEQVPAEEVPVEQAPIAAPTAAPAPSAPAGASSTAIPSAAGSVQPSAAAPTPAAAPATAPADAADEGGTDIATAAIGVSSISAALAGAVWLGLALARRRRGRRRPTTEIPVPVGLNAARVERQLREQAATVDITRMDQALRCAAALSRDRDAASLPDVTCVWLSGVELQLELATAVPAPAPFELIDDSWVLPATAVLPELDTAAAPFPALSTLGSQDGEVLMVDLERLGSVTVTGDPGRTAALLRHMAVEYAFSTWSDHLQITLVGWGADLVALNPDRLRHVATAAEVVTALRGRIADTAQAERDGNTTVLHGRLGESTDSDDDWVPEILLVDHAASEQESTELAQALHEVPGGSRAAVAVIVRAPHASDVTGAVIDITTAGRLRIPTVLGVDQEVQAAGTSVQEIAAILESFDKADVFRKPGPVQATDSWARDMDVTGALIAPPVPTPQTPDDDEVLASSPNRQSQDEPLLEDADLADVDVDDAGAEVGPNVIRLRSGAAYAALQAVLADDPELDADLQEWNTFPEGQFEVWQQEVALMASADPAKEARARGGLSAKDWVRRPRIGVLGEPMVLARGQMPSLRWGRFTEMCVYLAMHRQVDADKFVDNLWPHDAQPTGETRRSDISRCRSWLGTDPDDGRKYLPDARNKPYQLTRLLDIELFRRLRKRADAKTGVGDTQGALADLTAALDLIRGPVLAQSPRDAYSWLTVSDPADLSTAPFMVISTAHQLVELALQDNDLDLARYAADLAHLVGPDDDQPLVDLMRISHQAGDDAAARGWVASILRTNGVELVEDLTNYETFHAVNQVFPQGLRATTG